MLRFLDLVIYQGVMVQLASTRDRLGCSLSGNTQTHLSISRDLGSIPSSTTFFALKLDLKLKHQEFHSLITISFICYITCRVLIYFLTTINKPTLSFLFSQIYI